MTDAVAPTTSSTPSTPDTLWRALLAQDPDAPALDCPDAVVDRRAFEALVAAQAAAWQAQGLGTGDIVAWLGHNSAEQLAALLAAERVGVVLMPLNWRLATAELAACVRHAGVAALCVRPELQAAGDALLADLASAFGERGSARPGDQLLVYTSGTTGEPKGAMHTGAQLAANAHAAITVQRFSAATRTLSVLPMFHVGGLCIQLLPTLLAGGVARLHARFDPTAWLADVQNWRPTTSLMVPATLRAVIEHPAWAATDLSSLHFLNSGSSVVPQALIEAFHARGVPVAQVYGSTETGPFSIASDPAEAMRHPSAAGVPAPGVEIRLVDSEGLPVPEGQVGEIHVRGANVMRGYHRAPEHPDFREGWFHSGDLGRRRADGRYEVVGRAKDMIISGGENIYPAEIENLVLGLPGVAECAVVGLPDERWGEVPVLVVVAHSGVQLDVTTVRAVYESRLARFKHPRRVEVVDALPKTALGKVQKALLRRQLLP